MRTTFLIAGIVLCSSLVGCALLTGPDGGRRIGIVAWGDRPALQSNVRLDVSGTGGAAVVSDMDLPVLEMPDTVLAGAAFEVVVRTFGPNGCWVQAGTDLSIDSMTVEITAYDHEPQEGVCVQWLVRLPHTVHVSLPEAGQALVRVHGRKMNTDELFTLERQVVVR